MGLAALLFLLLVLLVGADGLFIRPHRHATPYRRRTMTTTTCIRAAFERMDDAELSGSQPKCIVVANSNNMLDSWHFETLDEILDAAVGGGLQIPVVILGADDVARETPRSLIDDGKYLAKDHVLPSRPLRYSRNDVPCVVLMSGLSRSAMRLIISGLKQWDSPERGPFPKLAFAMVVENSKDTKFSELLENIMNDWRENEG